MNLKNERRWYMTEFALILIKPDAIERGLKREIRNGLETAGLCVEEVGAVQFDLQLVMDFYQWPKIDHPGAMKDYICIEPLAVWIARGKNAIAQTMSLKSRLRVKYYNGPLKNLFHCPISQEESQWQYDLLINKGVIMTNQEARTRNQVEAIVFRQLPTGELSFLMLKRAPERGGFWQPVTGNVKVGETFETAAMREVQEELGITSVIQLIDTEYSYEFTDNNLDQFERIFGVEVSIDQEIRLSDEHTEYRWASKDEALKVYLKYPGNKEGLRRLHKIVVESPVVEGV